MKAEELRCGNWVMTPIYKEFRATPKTLYRLFKDEDSVQPIPLTGEWLVKFGFEYDKAWEGKVYVKQMGYGAAYYFSLYHNTMFKDIPAGCNEFHTTEIMYVHQLQNLYFALTGEELTIPNYGFCSIL
jgi:hypothetical protein